MAIITTQAAVADQPSDLSRRKFLATAAAGGAFMLGLRLPGAMCGRLRVGKSFLHVCSIGRCSHVFGLWMRFT